MVKLRGFMNSSVIIRKLTNASMCCATCVYPANSPSLDPDLCPDDAEMLAHFVRGALI